MNMHNRSAFNALIPAWNDGPYAVVVVDEVPLTLGGITGTPVAYLTARVTVVRDEATEELDIVEMSYERPDKLGWFQQVARPVRLSHPCEMEHHVALAITDYCTRDEKVYRMLDRELAGIEADWSLS